MLLGADAGVKPVHRGLNAHPESFFNVPSGVRTLTVALPWLLEDKIETVPVFFSPFECL